MRFPRTFAAATVTLTLSSAACQPQPSGGMGGNDAMVSAAATASIDSLRSSFAQTINGHDQRALAGLYTPDAVTIAPNGGVATGAQAIAQMFLGDTTVAYSGLTIAPDGGPTVVGDLAYETGTYSQTVTPMGGQAMQATGRYLVVLRKGADGSWRVARQANVPTLPMSGGGGS